MQEHDARAPQEMLSPHARPLGSGDLDEIAAGCPDDAIVVTLAGVRRTPQRAVHGAGVAACTGQIAAQASRPGANGAPA
jgi:hypothetical protein